MTDAFVPTAILGENHPLTQSWLQEWLRKTSLTLDETGVLTVHGALVRSGAWGWMGLGAWGRVMSLPARSPPVGRICCMRGYGDPKRFQWAIPAPGLSFSVFRFNVSSDPRGRQMTRHYSAVYFWEPHSAQYDSRKTENSFSWFSLSSLSARIASFKNSVFLMMPPCYTV